VWFADLAALGDPELVAVTVADVLGVRQEPGRPVTGTVVAAVGGRRLLVLLDNCEHVIQACAKLADALLRGCPNLALLATSREPLGVDGERVYRVPAFIAVCDLLHRRGIAGATALLGVDVEAHNHAKSFGRVALVPGGGGETAYVDEARQLGCDTFVTGEGSLFTRMFAKECGMNLLLATHQSTEAPGIRALGARLAEHAGIPWEFIDESPDVF